MFVATISGSDKYYASIKNKLLMQVIDSHELPGKYTYNASITYSASINTRNQHVIWGDASIYKAQA